jgi:hypothetical protein
VACSGRCRPTGSNGSGSRRCRPDAVAELTAGTDLDPDEVVRVTGGNPFFVTEVARGDEGLPASVADAVLARVQALPPAARAAVELLSVVAGDVTPPLVERLHLDPKALAAAETRGVLEVAADDVRFRHELARQAVVARCPSPCGSRTTRRCSAPCWSWTTTMPPSCTMRWRRAAGTS